jgi:rhodanese-related sulfurtransferase
VALKLMQQGYKNVYPLLGGFQAWRKAGYPVERRQNH